MKNDKEKSKNTGCLGILILFVILALIVIFNSTNDNDYSNNNNSETSSESISKSSSVSIKYSKVSLNVRERPNVKSKVIKVLNPNQKVTTNGKQENGFTQILDSSNRNYGWCSTKYLKDSPLSENELKELNAVKSSGYKLIEKEDLSFADFKGMNYKIQLNAKTIPDEDVLKDIAQTIWQSGNKHWEEFYVSVYFTDMSTKGKAYCELDYTSNGFEGITYNIEREVGSAIRSYVPDAWKYKDNSIGAWTIIKMAVKESLVSPRTAKFPWSGPSEHVTRNGQVYTIKSYVDSQNAFGAMIRTHFTAKVKQTEKDKWTLISFETY